jgi:hypothetical protein
MVFVALLLCAIMASSCAKLSLGTLTVSLQSFANIGTRTVMQGSLVMLARSFSNVYSLAWHLSWSERKLV